MPDDEPEDVENMQKRYQQLHAGESGDAEGANELDSSLYETLRAQTFQRLYELLREYQQLKEKKSINAALEAYGEKLMAVAETYQTQVASALAQQLQA